MSSMKNKRFSTRLGSKVELHVQQESPATMESSHQLLHLELNAKGDYVLPFSRRVIDISLPWLIKEQKQQCSSTMINHGRCLTVNADIVGPQQEIVEKMIHIIDNRMDKNIECPFHGDQHPDMFDPCACCRYYDGYYDDNAHDDDDDDDDDDDSVVEGQRMMDEFAENATKSCWARYGKSIPDDFINPFEIYDE